MKATYCQHMLQKFCQNMGKVAVILFHSLLLAGYMLLMGVVVHLFVVFYEEPQLNASRQGMRRCDTTRGEERSVV